MTEEGEKGRVETIRYGAETYWKVDGVKVTEKNLRFVWSEIVLPLPRDVRGENGKNQAVKACTKHKGYRGDTKAFNGGSNRADFYFPYYINPLIVLDFLGYITKKRGSKNWVRKTNVKEISVDGLKVEEKDSGQRVMDNFS